MVSPREIEGQGYTSEPGGGETPLPTLHLSLGFTAEQMVRRIRRTPQSRLLNRLYGYTKELEGSTSSVESVAEGLEQFLQLSDEDFRRVIILEQPTTTDEEEYLRIRQIRGSLTVFSWSCIAQSTMPREVKYAFSTTAEHLTDGELIQATETVEEWGYRHKTEDVPLQLSPDMKAQIEKIHQEMYDYAEFCNRNSRFIDNQSVTDDQKASVENTTLVPWLVNRRVSMVREFILYFGTKRAMSQFRHDSHRKND